MGMRMNLAKKPVRNIFNESDTNILATGLSFCFMWNLQDDESRMVDLDEGGYSDGGYTWWKYSVDIFNSFDKELVNKLLLINYSIVAHMCVNECDRDELYSYFWDDEGYTLNNKIDYFDFVEFMNIHEMIDEIWINID